MKKFNKFLSMILAVSLLLCMTACNSGSGNESSVDISKLVKSDDSRVVMSIGDHVLTECEYNYIASYLKDYTIYYYQNVIYQQYGVAPEESDLLKMAHPTDSTKTFADFIQEYIVEVSQQLLIIEMLCAESNLTLTNEEDIKSIDEYVKEIEYAYGGEDLFDIKLTQLGFSKSGIARFQRMYVLSDLLQNHRYGDNGVARIPQETVHKYFLDNYIYFDGASYYYATSVDEIPDIFKVTDDEIVDYFNKNYVRVNHILYKTIDSSGKDLNDEAKTEKKKKAEDALASINSGEKTFVDWKSETEDKGFQYTFTYGEMVEPFEKAAFGEWNDGEVKLVETEYGYHLMEKVLMSETDIQEAVFGKKDDKGELTGGLKESIFLNMYNATIRDAGKSEIAKLQSGELSSYPAENKDSTYYELTDATFIDKNNSNYTMLIDSVKDVKNGVYVEKEIQGSGLYVLRKLDFEAKDITAEIYKTIETEYVYDEFLKYVQSYYDKITTNNEVLSAFDVITLPALEEEFYVE